MCVSVCVCVRVCEPTPSLQAPHVSAKRLHNQRKRRKRRAKEDELSPVSNGEAESPTPSNTREDPPTLNPPPKAHFNDDSSGEDNAGQSVQAAEALRDSGGGDEVLAEPEIRGLWDRGRGGAKGRGRGKSVSKLEEEMMKKALETLRTSVVGKQVAAGREFQVSQKGGMEEGGRREGGRREGGRREGGKEGASYVFVKATSCAFSTRI